MLVNLPDMAMSVNLPSFPSLDYMSLDAAIARHVEANVCPRTPQCISILCRGFMCNLAAPLI